MSSAKFASMSASLLARKGEASPSLATLPPRPSVFVPHTPTSPPGPRRLVTAAAQEEATEKPRRIVITLSMDEYEKLCIAAAKKSQTRHQIVRTALDAFFLKFAAELPQPCRCMTEGPCCS